MKSRNLPIICFGLLIALFFQPLSVSAQKVVAEVNVVLDKLPMEKRDKMTDFSQKLTDYINQYEWCEDQYQTEIPVKIQIYLQDASVSYEDRYRGNLLISNTVDMQFYDKRWLFNYDSMEPMLHIESQFDPLTSVIDFYIYMLLGGEFDRYGTLLGTPYYNLAKKINEQARFSRFIQGWDERTIVIRNILDEKNKPYRLAIDSYYLGLSYSEDDFNKTLKHCKHAIELIAQLIQTNPDYKLPHQFIDGHRNQIIDLFKEANDRADIFKTLIAIDPDHKDNYKEFL